MSRRWTARNTWSTVAWLGFVGIMVVRVGMGASSGGIGMVVLTFLLIAFSTAVLFVASVAVLRAQRRPVLRTVTAIRERVPGVVAGQIAGANDLYLGLKLAGFGAATEGPSRLRSVLGVAFSAEGVEFWSGRNTTPEVRIPRAAIVDLRDAVADNPLGRRPSVILTIHTDRDIMLPFVVINEAGTGAMPMNEARTSQFAAQARDVLGLRRTTSLS